MYEVTTEEYFSAAHHLRDYNGPCEKVHGHNWLVRASVRCEGLNELGLGIDFKELKKLLISVLEKLDHSDINVIFEKEKCNPSSENIARYIYIEMDKKLKEPGCKVSRVDVYETPGNCASYYE